MVRKHFCRYLMFPIFGLALSCTSQAHAPFLASASIEDVRLQNGIRLVYLPHVESSSPPAFVDIVFGYTVGLRDEGGYPKGMLSIMENYLAVSSPARAIAMVTHFSGGQVDFIRELDLVGMRVRVPLITVEALLKEIAAYFEQDLDEDLLEYARARAAERALVHPTDFLVDVNDDLRRALFDGHPYERRILGRETYIKGVENDQIVDFYSKTFGTDRAFFISSDQLSKSALDRFGGVQPRSSQYSEVASAPTERDFASLDFLSRPIGGLIVATLTPSVHFRDWFMTLALDRLIREVGPLNARTEFRLSRDPFFHRMEVAVKIPNYPEDVREELIEYIGQLRYSGVSLGLLKSIKNESLRFLALRSTQEWFVAHDLWGSLEDGRRALQTLTVDELRSAAQRMLNSRRVTATWAPAFTEPTVEVENLDDSSEVEADFNTSIPKFLEPTNIALLTPNVFPPLNPVEVERLNSGITLAASEQFGLFIAGEFQEDLPGGISSCGPNGVFWLFQDFPKPAVFERLRAVRPARILIFLPESFIVSERGRFEEWSNDSIDFTPMIAVGKVATGDIPSLLTLKMWLDGRIIEAGWLRQVTLRIDSQAGSQLLIETDLGREVQVRRWIHEVAEQGISEDEFLRSRFAAVGYFESIKSHLQVFLWQRDPLGVIRSPATGTLSRLRTVARIYF